MVEALAMNLRLVVEKARGQRQVLRINRADAIVGRSHGNAVRIPSRQVSRQHCRLRQTDGVVTVEDLDSVNGTFVNGQLVSGPQLVRPGDRLAIGPVTFVVYYELSDDALQRYKAGSGEGEAIAEVLPVEEDERSSIEEMEEVLPVKGLESDDLPLPLAEEEDALPEHSIFEVDNSRWQVPDGGLRDLLWELDERDDEAETD